MALSYQAARHLILQHIDPMDTETVPLLEALGRALAEPVIAPLDLPRFDNSAMDGYALRAADSGPGAQLRITGYLLAGSLERPVVEAGCAVRIMTGAPLPPGADAVVPLELTDGDETLVRLRGPVPQGDHIRWQGEDVRAGQEILSPGTVLRPAEISLLASCNRTEVAVTRRPQVAILSTGDELVEVGTPLEAGRIVNSNSWSLAASVQELGGIPLQLGIARDNRECLREKLAQGLRADMLITSAGVSTGDLDLVREVLAEFGVEQHIWKVDIKPGRPTAFATRGKVPVFSLPGNPVATLVTFEEFVRPALLKMLGQRQVIKPLLRARLQQPVRKKPGRAQFLRVRVQAVNGQLVASSSGDQNTGILRTSLLANAIAVLPPDQSDYAAGDEVEIHLLGRDGEWLSTEDQPGKTPQ